MVKTGPFTAEFVLLDIGEPGAFGGNPPFWHEALAAMPDAPLPFLDSTTIPARRAAAGLPCERDTLLREVAGAFYELLALEFVPRLTAWHRQSGYPQDVTAQTLLQIASFESNHLRGRGVPASMSASSLGWPPTLCNPISGSDVSNTSYTPMMAACACGRARPMARYSLWRKTGQGWMEKGCGWPPMPRPRQAGPRT